MMNRFLVAIAMAVVGCSSHPVNDAGQDAASDAGTLDASWGAACVARCPPCGLECGSHCHGGGRTECILNAIDCDAVRACLLDIGP